MIQYDKPSISVITVDEVDIITESLGSLQQGISDKNTLPLWKEDNSF